MEKCKKNCNITLVLRVISVIVLIGPKKFDMINNYLMPLTNYCKSLLRSRTGVPN